MSFSKDNVEYLFEIAHEVGKSGDHQEAILAYKKVINSDLNIIVSPGNTFCLNLTLSIFIK